MTFSLVICTYMRSQSLYSLLQSVTEQSLYPDQIIIVDGSTNDNTKELLVKNKFRNLDYYLVDKKDRGLTKQRNYGINKVNDGIDIVCFLDDDVILEKNYFKLLINTYTEKTDAIAVGGFISNEIIWKKRKEIFNNNEYELDGFIRKMGRRNVIRKYFGLLSNVDPGIMPLFSNGFSISFLPPSGEIYRVEYFMGCAMSFKNSILKIKKFSTYFEGYGLYEDLDFCLRVSKIGKLYVNTSAQLEHHHDASGRPNQYKYGKMVMRNGWYVWRVKYPNPTLKSRFKWNATALLLTFIRFTNIFTTNKRKEAASETFGRIIGWFSLFLYRPQ